MRRSLILAFVLTLLLALAGPALPLAATAQADGPRTYTVLVGLENPQRGVDVMAFSPATLRIHVGDTVLWKQATHEIHTVTFLAGGAIPDLLMAAPQPNPLNSPFMFNPLVAFTAPATGSAYDGATYANSGIMSLDPGLPQSYSLTFIAPGTFGYLCAVHGVVMSGTIIVEPASAMVPPPRVATLQGRMEMVRAMAPVPAAFAAAVASVPAPTRNPDGTTTHYVVVGYETGQLALMRFFPSRLVVHPGDTVVWKLVNSAPHTVTFLNGSADIPFAVFVPPPAGPMLLVNPAVLAPLSPGMPLTRDGVFSSGFMPAPGLSYTLVIGDIAGSISYECLLHDTSGMSAALIVAPAGSD